MARHEHTDAASEPQNDQADQPADQKAEGVDTSQVDAAIAKEQEQGFRGVKVDPNPNEEYSLQTGPDSPTSEGGPITQHHLKEA